MNLNLKNKILVAITLAGALPVCVLMVLILPQLDATARPLLLVAGGSLLIIGHLAGQLAAQLITRQLEQRLSAMSVLSKAIVEHADRLRCALPVAKDPELNSLLRFLRN